jgi:hypothetical protein
MLVALKALRALLLALTLFVCGAGAVSPLFYSFSPLDALVFAAPLVVVWVTIARLERRRRGRTQPDRSP